MDKRLLLVAIASSPVCAQAQLILPYYGTDSSTTQSAFQVMKTGSSGRANTLYITEPANSSDVLLANTVGGGRVGYFRIDNASSSSQAIRAESNGSGVGVFGYMTGTGRAGMFRITNANNSNNAIYALTNGTGAAIKAECNTGGIAAALFGRLEVNVSDGDNPAAYFINSVGYAIAASGQNYGVRAFGHDAIAAFGTSGSAFNGQVSGPAGRAVVGSAYSLSGVTYGGFLKSDSSEGTGVVGYCPSATGITYGMKGNVASPDGYALYAVGRFTATGTKAFQIDHPLNPANEYLNHYCAEAPQPQNFYNGNVVTDARGYATVSLPDYFSSINVDPKYSLTVIDKSDDFVLAKVVDEIRDNRFTIRTSKPRVKVSWRIDAVRNDRWVKMYGYQAEQPKAESERGKFVQPELYDQPAEKGIHYTKPLPEPVAAGKYAKR